jgi:uncharacterized repeat protein (TIGR02543 family)
MAGEATKWLGLVALLLAGCGDHGSGQYQLLVIASGGGTVTSSPDGIDCESDAGLASACAADFSSGSQVSLSAQPAGTLSFLGWQGSCGGNNNNNNNNNGGGGGGDGGSTPCDVNMNSDEQVVAQFGSGNGGGGNFLTVGVMGGGSVASSPSGINCPGQCSASFSPGTNVTLTPQPNGGSTFTGWSGACTGNASCNVVMNGNQNVTASFTP